ncbi:MAG: ABC transporter substrate-binding protein [Geodermatophilaceae bacterium]
MTAEDVAYGIKRSFDRRTFPNSPPYSSDYFLDGDAYRGPYRSGTDYDGVTVEGDTLTIRMERPFPDMPYWGSFPAMGPIPERGSDPADYARHPLATGPYKIADHTLGKSLTLVRNDEWDPDTDPGRHAYPDTYEFSTAPLEQIHSTILGDSRQGQTALTYDSVLPGHYRRAQRLDRLTIGATQCTFMFRPDYRDITDVRVRRAIGYAFPYEETAKLNGAIVGVTLLRGGSILPPGFPGRQEYDVLETEPGETDPAKAKALLKEAGWAPGEFDLTFVYADDEPDSAKFRDLFMDSYEAAGFKATPFVARRGSIHDLG